MINTCQTDHGQYQITAPHRQDANNTKVTNCHSDRYYGNREQKAQKWGRAHDGK